MIRVQTGSVTFLQFPHLSEYPEIFHGVFCRHGGRSRGPFQSLNVGLGVGDDPAAVSWNRDLLSGCFEHPRLVPVRQVHGDDVHCIREKSEISSIPPAADALISGLAGLGLMIQVADCQAVLLYDPVAKVSANIHSGWRGSLRNIVGKTVRTMAAEFRSRPENVLAGIGPSLGPCCAEFVHYRSEIPETLWHYRVSEHHFDFWSMTRDQLAAERVRVENILCANICTVCNTGDYYSYRAEKITGRFAAVIGKRPAREQ